MCSLAAACRKHSKADITLINSFSTFKLFYSTSTSAHYFLHVLVKDCWTLLVHPLYRKSSTTTILPFSLPNIFKGCAAPSFLSLQWDSTESLCVPQIRLCPLLPLLSMVSWRTAQGCRDSVTHASRTSLSFCAVGWLGGSGKGCGQSVPG